MKQITKVEQKEQVANKIKELVKEINKHIEASNNEALFIDITFQQNTDMKPKNSYLNVWITETISY